MARHKSQIFEDDTSHNFITKSATYVYDPIIDMRKESKYVTNELSLNQNIDSLLSK